MRGFGDLLVQVVGKAGEHGFVFAKLRLESALCDETSALPAGKRLRLRRRALVAAGDGEALLMQEVCGEKADFAEAENGDF